MVIYYSKKVQSMAFNAAKQNNSEESYIDKKHFRLFIESIL